MGRRRSNGLTTADRYGDIGAGVEWRAILEHYFWDRVDVALELANNLGAVYGGATLRMYRLIEGEAVTRRRSQIEPVGSWLQIETIGDEVDRVGSLSQRVMSACEDAGERLGWDHREQAMVSVLASEADSPWHAARFGYYEDKYPYDKICIPNRATLEPEELEAVVRHEYAHLIVTNMTGGRAPMWVHEGIAMLLEGGRESFEVREWLSPEGLEEAFGAERREASSARRVWSAYGQAAELVRRLHHLGGDEGIRRFLASFTDVSFWDELKMRALDAPVVDVALRNSYGLSVDQLWSS